jgi:hypothetical protein
MFDAFDTLFVRTRKSIGAMAVLALSALCWAAYSGHVVTAVILFAASMTFLAAGIECISVFTMGAAWWFVMALLMLLLGMPAMIIIVFGSLSAFLAGTSIVDICFS